MTGILNLKKNDILDLRKAEPGLKHVVLAAGWDVAKKGFFGLGTDYDLDLIAILLNENDKMINRGVIYFGNLNGPGIYLHGDNRTGAGEGDDEVININLEEINPNIAKIVFVVTIHEAQAKRQTFGMVENSYVRLVDLENNKREICRFNLKENGSTATSVIFAELNRKGSEWQFKAIGEGKIADLNGILGIYM